MSKIEKFVAVVVGVVFAVFYVEFVFNMSYPFVINFLTFVGLISMFSVAYFGFMIELFVRVHKE